MDIFEPWRNAPPARHTLESDSEEEQDPEDVYRQDASSSTRRRKPQPVVEMHWTRDRPSTVDSHELIVAHDEAGLYWSQGLDINSLNADAFLLVDGIKAASITSLEEPNQINLVFIAASLSYEAMHAVSEQLLRELQPSKITIIDSYSYSSYLSSAPPKPSIRYLSTEEDNDLPVAKFQPPNLIQGLPAALACHADEQDIPATMLLFPSNLSDSTSAYVVVHSAHRQPVPDGIYDYGGPLPSSESLLAREDNRRALTNLSQKLEWGRFGWTVPSSSNREPKSRKGSQSRNQAGFGWWEEAKRAQRQAVADGGMYI